MKLDQNGQERGRQRRMENEVRTGPDKVKAKWLALEEKKRDREDKIVDLNRFSKNRSKGLETTE
jgi:hypothetical protein